MLKCISPYLTEEYGEKVKVYFGRGAIKLPGFT